MKLLNCFSKKGAKIEMLTNNGIDDCLKAIKNKRILIIKLLIENGVDMNKEEKLSKSLLNECFSVSKNDDLIEIIKLMILKGGKFNKKDALNNIHESNKELIKLIESTNDLVKEAIKLKNINMIKILIKKGCIDESIFLEIIRLNNLELLQFYCEHVKITLTQNEILEKIINDAIEYDILTFIYEKIK